MTQTSALLLTLALEVPVALALAGPAARGATRWRRLLPIAVAASACTHPLLWLADAALARHLDWGARVAALEVAVVGVEAVVYAAAAGLGARRAVLVSVAANGVSLGVGLALYAWGLA